MLDLADFALQEQPEDNLKVAISWAWYNGSYSMAAKPIKSLELHYTIIHFLMKVFSSFWHKLCLLCGIISRDLQTRMKNYSLESDYEFYPGCWNINLCHQQQSLYKGLPLHRSSTKQSNNLGLPVSSLTRQRFCECFCCEARLSKPLLLYQRVKWYSSCRVFKNIFKVKTAAG